jgi:hypothetical protein
LSLRRKSSQRIDSSCCGRILAEAGAQVHAVVRGDRATRRQRADPPIRFHPVTDNLGAMFGKRRGLSPFLPKRVIIPIVGCQVFASPTASPSD